MDERVLSGLRAQLELRGKLLEGGAQRIGWKIGLNDPAVQERVGLREPVIGFLTSAGRLEPGASHSLAGATAPALEVEIAIGLRRRVDPGAEPDATLAAIDSLGPAIELVDIDRSLDDLEAVLAGNVFHRAVVLGESRQDVSVGEVRATLEIDGVEAGSGPARVDLHGTIRLVADMLGACGERLRAGELIIAGALLPAAPAAAGSTARADLGPLGTVELRLEP